MRGLKSSDLVSVVDFLYQGEVNILQDDLNDFLSLAEELQLKGLVGAEYKIEEKFQNHTIKQIHKLKTYVTPKVLKFAKEENNVVFESPPSTFNTTNLETTQIAQISGNEDLKQKMDELIEQNGDNWSCKVCGKVANKAVGQWKRNLQRHTQIHMEGLLYTCNLCAKEFKCKIYLDNHMSKTHNTI